MKYLASVMLLAAVGLAGCSKQDDQVAKKAQEKTEVQQFAPKEMPYKL